MVSGPLGSAHEWRTHTAVRTQGTGQAVEDGPGREIPAPPAAQAGRTVGELPPITGHCPSQDWHTSILNPPRAILRNQGSLTNWTIKEEFGLERVVHLMEFAKIAVALTLHGWLAGAGDAASPRCADFPCKENESYSACLLSSPPR